MKKIAFTYLLWVNEPQINYPISRNPWEVIISGPVDTPCLAHSPSSVYLSPGIRFRFASLASPMCRVVLSSAAPRRDAAGRLPPMPGPRAAGLSQRAGHGKAGPPFRDTQCLGVLMLFGMFLFQFKSVLSYLYLAKIMLVDMGPSHCAMQLQPSMDCL